MDKKDRPAFDGEKMRFLELQRCVICGKDFRAYRIDAKTCSGKCRKARSRAGTREPKTRSKRKDGKHDR